MLQCENIQLIQILANLAISIFNKVATVQNNTILSTYQVIEAKDIVPINRKLNIRYNSILLVIVESIYLIEELLERCIKVLLVSISRQQYTVSYLVLLNRATSTQVYIGRGFQVDLNSAIELIFLLLLEASSLRAQEHVVKELRVLLTQSSQLYYNILVLQLGVATFKN